jgi:hypothetical protein
MCIFQEVNNQHYRVVQWRNAAYTKSLQETSLSLACLSRSMEISSFASLSLSLLLLCVCIISFSLFCFCHCWDSCSLSVSLPCLFYSLQGICFSYLSFLLDSGLTLLLVLLAPNSYLMHSASPLPLFFLRRQASRLAIFVVRFHLGKYFRDLECV